MDDCWHAIRMHLGDNSFTYKWELGDERMVVESTCPAFSDQRNNGSPRPGALVPALLPGGGGIARAAWRLQLVPVPRINDGRAVLPLSEADASLAQLAPTDGNDRGGDWLGRCLNRSLAKPCRSPHAHGLNPLTWSPPSLPASIAFCRHLGFRCTRPRWDQGAISDWVHCKHMPVQGPQAGWQPQDYRALLPSRRRHNCTSPHSCI